MGMETKLEHIKQLGGLGIFPSLVSAEAWNSIAGMATEKDLIERKILLPLLHPELASKHGVSPPRALLLFGPPGTGKTTFSKGIAGKLGWLFVEVSRSDLASEGLEKVPLRLRSLFDQLLGLEEAVVFFDEFEELAIRPERTMAEEKGVSYEMLRQLPRFRDARKVLLICATNNIRLVNPALLRVGRFDYILPIGPMDSAAREAVFRYYLGKMNTGDIDFAQVASKSEYFTPADIEAVCASVAQAAFEREMAQGSDYRIQTEDVMHAIDAHRPTISAAELDQFRKDMQEFCRADHCEVLTGAAAA